MAKARVSPALARVMREARLAAPAVNPRVSAQRALQLLGKLPNGRQLLRRLERVGAPAAPTQIAYFTPRTWTGNVGFIDIFNADLRAWSSGLTETYQKDQVCFDARGDTAYDDLNLKHPNGVVQAFFDLEEEAQVLAVAKLSSENARVYLALDSRYGDTFQIHGNGVEVATLRPRAAGVHRVNVIQRRTPRNPIWFHSITVFQV
jgi:hypothetical protein